jgi:phosphonate degradation associated HDIG domain protein
VTADDVKAQSVAEVFDLYLRWGHEHYDEEISQLDHALQTAALAVASGARPQLVAAALLHDVGHLLELEMSSEFALGTTDLHHESLGAKYLGALFADDVTASIARHVRAKRYLCAVDPTYHAELSAGSQRSLELQGGPLSSAEVTAFERLPGWEDAVLVRRWDDGGKVEGLTAGPLTAYRSLLDELTA